MVKSDRSSRDSSLAENNEVQLVIDNKVVSLRFVERVSDKPIGETNPEDAKKDDQK